MAIKVFLGGTCNNSTWRDGLIPLLTVDYFNPVVDNWDEEAKAQEDHEKNVACDVHLYVITKEMEGAYSIAEAVDSAHRGILTLFCVLPEGFSKAHIKSFNAIIDLLNENTPSGSGFIIEGGVQEIATILNGLEKGE